jgi:glycosyltransferase involved in cell wall biosynthesis
MINFTVCVPLYNKQETITRSLNSIKLQTYMLYDVLIINDGSSDASERVVNEWLQLQDVVIRDKFQLINQTNKGIYQTRQRLISLASSNFIAWLDADDEWFPNHLQELVQLIEQYKDQVALYSTAFWKEQKGIKKKHRLGRYEAPFTGVVDYFEAMSISSGFIQTSVACIDKVRLLDLSQEINSNEDLLMWSLLACDRGLAFSSLPTGVYHLDNTEASSKGSLAAINYYIQEVIQKSVSWQNRGKVLKYLHVFARKNIAAIRLSLKYRTYLFNILSSIGSNSFMVSFYAISLLLIPKKILSKFML